jgi:hypothetical protein
MINSNSIKFFYINGSPVPEIGLNKGICCFVEEKGL